MTFPVYQLGEFANLVKRPEEPEPGKLYRQVGVRLWGQGAYDRGSIDGSETKYKTLTLLKEDDIVVNKIWARNGSVSVVSAELDGCFGSPEFPIYEINPDRLLPFGSIGSAVRRHCGGNAMPYPRVRVVKIVSVRNNFWRYVCHYLPWMIRGRLSLSLIVLQN